MKLTSYGHVIVILLMWCVYRWVSFVRSPVGGENEVDRGPATWHRPRRLTWNVDLLHRMARSSYDWHEDLLGGCWAMVWCGRGLVEQAIEAVLSVVRSGSVIMVESTRMCVEAVGGLKWQKLFLIAYFLLDILILNIVRKVNCQIFYRTENFISDSAWTLIQWQTTRELSRI
jgi:hypothetical protein